MTFPENNLTEFTSAASESLYYVADQLSLQTNSSARLIYKQLRDHLRAIPFCDYLKRYIYQKANLTAPFEDIPFEEYRTILRESFADNDVPPSFYPTTAKLSALTKNWLTQFTVRRSVVFLLGFGLGMTPEDVNDFLQKALHEPEIHAKNPFEVLCYYCYQNNLSYNRFRDLWNTYLAMPPSDGFALDSEETAGYRRSMLSITDEGSLMQYLAGLKTPENTIRCHVTARNTFLKLYDETREAVADLYNRAEEERISGELLRMRDQLSFNTRMYDYEKQKRLEKLRKDQQIFTTDSITEGDIEHILYAAVPTDRHGNLIPSKNSSLNELFRSKRFCRQHIYEVLSGSMEVDRFDLITMSFFLYSQKEFPTPKRRYFQFTDSVNTLLSHCGMHQLYPANPYECFLIMCMLADDPLATYSEVWEMSYRVDV